ncbi:MAG: cache domain-containing protein [Alphaproteobacteria bacterium]|nr:cache domain-containing protein [Alphaproteobacteria bacterium]
MILLVVACFQARADDIGSLDEAVALLNRAVTAVKTDGKDAAFAKFNSKDGGFVDRDLYVFVFGLDGMTLAHGGNPAMVGRNVGGVKDVDGKPFMKDMLDLAKSAGEGWIDYKWLNPTTHKIDAKRSYIKRIDDYLVGVGAYVK